MRGLIALICVLAFAAAARAEVTLAVSCGAFCT